MENKIYIAQKAASDSDYFLCLLRRLSLSFSANSSKKQLRHASKDKLYSQTWRKYVNKSEAPS